MLTCSKCNKEFSTYVIIDGKSRNLCNRKRCLECQPWKAPRFPTRTPSQKKQAELEKSKKCYLRQKAEHGVCLQTIRMRARKAALINLLGGGCCLCKYDRTSRNLAFHHCFDKEDALDARAMAKSLSWVLFEMSKCVMVCHNCHGEIHDGLVDVRDKYEEFQKKVVALKGKTWKDITDRSSTVEQESHTLQGEGSNPSCPIGANKNA
jgi:hypothetical protein